MNFGDKIKSGFQRWWQGGRTVQASASDRLPRMGFVQAQADTSPDLTTTAHSTLLEGAYTLKKSLSTVEICAGYWARAFEGSKVFIDGKPIEKYAVGIEALKLRGMLDVGITPQILALMGRQIMTFGESIFKINRSIYSTPKILLLPAVSSDISGYSIPETWIYNLEINSPDGRNEDTGAAQNKTEPYTVAASDVVHVTYATYTDMPWLGISPLSLSRKTYKTLQNLDKMFESETAMPSGMIMPIWKDTATPSPDGTMTEFADLVAQQLTEQSGSIRVLEQPSQLPEAMDKPMPQGLLHQIRYGFTAEGANTEFRKQLEMNIVEACGLPASIVVTDRGSRAVRDGMRQFIDMSIAPKLKSVSSELSHKLGMDISIYPDKSFDAATFARAMGTLTRSMGKDEDGNMLPGAMRPQDAARIVGLPLELFADEPEPQREQEQEQETEQEQESETEKEPEQEFETVVAETATENRNRRFLL